MADVKAQAEELEGWTLEEETLKKKFKFDNYLDGLAFVQNLGVYAESVQHHPHISIIYTNITVKWTTHSDKALTEKDVAAAKATDNVYKL